MIKLALCGDSHTGHLRPPFNPLYLFLCLFSETRSTYCCIKDFRNCPWNEIQSIFFAFGKIILSFLFWSGLTALCVCKFFFLIVNIWAHSAVLFFPLYCTWHWANVALDFKQMIPTAPHKDRFSNPTVRSVRIHDQRSRDMQKHWTLHKRAAVFSDACVSCS